MNIRATHIDAKRKGQPMVLMRLKQDAQMRKRYIAQISRWRHPLVGFLLAFPVVGLAIFLMLLENYLIPHFPFPGAPMYLAIVLVALIWGIGPALLAVVLSTVALDYFYLSPLRRFSLDSWPGM